MDRVEIYCYDYVPYTNNYDEFEKTGTSFLDLNYKLDCNAGLSNSNFAYFTKAGKQTISFIFSYEGVDWMFANEVIFLLDNGNTIKLPLKHTRKLEGLICKETCIVDLDIDHVKSLLKQSSAKYKVNAEKFSVAYSLNPALISSNHYMIECIDNNKWIN